MGVVTLGGGVGNTLDISGAGFDLIVGQAGHGTLNVLNGSDVSVTQFSDDFLIGNLATRACTLNVEG